MRTLFVVVVSAVVGAIVGYRVGQWWLNRTVVGAELETAVYPAVGAIVGLLVGVAIATLVLRVRRL